MVGAVRWRRCAIQGVHDGILLLPELFQELFDAPLAFQPLLQHHPAQTSTPQPA
jgi:hypothetical protein